MIETDQDLWIMNRDKNRLPFSNNSFARFAQISDISSLRELVSSVQYAPTSSQRVYIVPSRAFKLVYVHESQCVPLEVSVTSTAHTCVAFAPTLLPGFVSAIASALASLPSFPSLPLSKALRVLQVWKFYARVS